MQPFGPARTPVEPISTARCSPGCAAERSPDEVPDAFSFHPYRDKPPETFLDDISSVSFAADGKSFTGVEKPFVVTEWGLEYNRRRRLKIDERPRRLPVRRVLSRSRRPSAGRDVQLAGPRRGRRQPRIQLWHRRRERDAQAVMGSPGAAHRIGGLSFRQSVER